MLQWCGFGVGQAQQYCDTGDAEYQWGCMVARYHFVMHVRSSRMPDVADS